MAVISLRDLRVARSWVALAAARRAPKARRASPAITGTPARISAPAWPATISAVTEARRTASRVRARRWRRPVRSRFPGRAGSSMGRTRFHSAPACCAALQASARRSRQAATNACQRQMVAVFVGSIAMRIFNSFRMAEFESTFAIRHTYPPTPIHGR